VTFAPARIALSSSAGYSVAIRARSGDGQQGGQAVDPSTRTVLSPPYGWADLEEWMTTASHPVETLALPYEDASLG
jgi:hypothetical protein